MAIRHGVVPVGPTPTPLLTGADADLKRGNTLGILPEADVWIGSEGVTVADGWPVAAGTKEFLDLDSLGLTAGDVPYGISASGTVNVRYIRSGV